MAEKGLKNEYNFIGLRSYIHRPTKLTSSAYEVKFMKRRYYDLIGRKTDIGCVNHEEEG